jgi:chemotaxis protein methyltransferase CheR
VSAVASWFDVIASVVKQGSGLVIGPDKLYLLETRLSPILSRERLRDLPSLAQRLQVPGNAALVRDVIEAMATNESLFFRNEKPFEYFGNVVLPRLLAVAPSGSAIRIWSAAAASGQEPYSIAMVLEEHRNLIGSRPIEIIATDIARQQLERARRGFYSDFEVNRGLPEPLRARYFSKERGGWRINQKMRQRVKFQEWNLISDLRPLGKFDVVFCRNVLIYFDDGTRRRVLDAIADQMESGGVLFVGGSETLVGLSTRFAPIDGQPGTYQARPRPRGAFEWPDSAFEWIGDMPDKTYAGEQLGGTQIPDCGDPR